MKPLKKVKKGTKNVFKDLGFADLEAANLEARSRLMILLEQEIRSLNLSQAEVARKLDVKPPRVSELLHGHIEKFGLDLLIRYLARLGKAVEFSLKEAA